MHASNATRVLVLALGLVFTGIAVATFQGDDDPRVVLEKARDMLASGKGADAAKLLDGIQGDAKTDAFVREARATQVRALVVASDFERAIESGLALLRDISPTDPWRGRVDAEIARAYEGKGDVGSALLRESATAEWAISEDNLARIASTYVKLADRYAVAKADPSGLRPPTPPNYELGAECLAHAIGVLANKPQVVDLKLRRAEMRLQAGSQNAVPFDSVASELSEAIELMNKAKEESGRLGRGYFLLARARLGLRMFAEAKASIAAFRAMKGAEDSPLWPEASKLLGETWVQSGEAGSLARGLEVWAAELKRTPDAPIAFELRRAMATACVSVGAFDRALPLLDDVAQAPKAPALDVAWALRQKTIALGRLERFDDARTACRAFLAQYPSDSRVPEVQRELADLLVYKAIAAEKAKRLDDAVASLRSFIEEYPLDSRAPDVSLEVVRILRAAKSFDAARNAAREARDRWLQDNQEVAARAGFAQGVIEEEDRKDLEGAVSAFRFVAEKLGNTSSANLARVRLANLEAIDLGLEVRRAYAPGEPVVVNLRTRNVKDVTFRVYRLDAKAYFDRKGTLNGTNDIDVALVKSDKTIAQPIKDYVRYRLDRSDITIPDAAEGAWIVSAEAEQRRALVTVLVTRVRVVVKQGTSGIFAWATDAKSGDPLADVNIIARNGDFRVEGKTTVDGTVRLSVPAGKGPCEVVAVSGNSVTPGFGVPAAASGQEGLTPRLHWVLDRPVLRPGDALRYVAFLREVKDGNHVSSEGTEVTMTWLDPKGRMFSSEQVKTAAFGRLEGEVRTPEAGMPGNWTLRAAFGSFTFNQDVTVKVFTTPEYKVDVSTQKRTVNPGDEVTASIKVESWSGGVVPGARFDYSVTAVPAAFDDARYRDSSWWYRATEKTPRATPSGKNIANGSGTCDEQGQASISFKVENIGNPTRYLVRAMVLDSAQGFISGSQSLVASFTPGHVVVIPDRRAYRSGDRLSARVVAVDWMSGPLALSGDAELIAIRTEGAKRVEEVLSRLSLNLGSTGEAEARLELPKAASCVLRFTGTDAKGMKVVGEFPVEVTGERPDLAKEARLLFEREAWGAGVSARAFIDAPAANGKALVTFEGEGVLEHRLIDITSRNMSFEHVLGEHLAPNVTATLSLWHDHKLLTSEDAIIVLRKLDVVVTPSAKVLEPGASVTLDVVVKDQTGKPASAAVVIAMTDAALDSLSDTAVQDVRFTLNRDRRPHLVRTGASSTFRQEVSATALDADLLSVTKVNTGLEAYRRLKLEAGAPVGAVIGGRFGGFDGGEKELNEAAKSDALAENGRPALTPAEKSGSADRDNALGKLKAPGSPPGGAFGFSGTGGGGVLGGGPAPKGQTGGTRMGRRSAQAERKPRGDVALGMDLKKDSKSGESDEQEDMPALRELKDGWGENSDKREQLERQILDLHTIGGLPAANPVEVNIRSNFADVAAWAPSLVTDADGRAQMTVKLPDNLTTWSASATAINAAVSGGTGDASIRATRSVTLRVPLPIAFNHKDEIRTSAVVRNTTGSELTLNLDAKSDDPMVATLSGATTGSMKLAAGASGEWPLMLTGKRPGSARLVTSAKSETGGDALQVSRPVRAFGAPWDGSQRLSVTDDAMFDLTIPELVDGSLSASVLIQADLATDLLEGLSFLMDARGGGLETSTNRVIASLALHRALTAAGRPSRVVGDRVESAARALVGEIRAMMADNGMIVDSSGVASPTLTGLAGEALARLREMGIQIPADTTRIMIAGCDAGLARGGVTVDDRAWLLLALGMLGADRPAPMNALLRDRDALAPVSLARSVLAAAGMNKEVAVAGFMATLRSRRRSGDGLPFDKTAQAWFNSDQEATAMAILAFRRGGAREDEIAAMVKALRKSLALRGCVHTRAAASSVIALAEEAATSAVVEGEANITLDGAQVGQPVRISGASPYASIALPVAGLTKGPHKVRVRRTGAGEVTVRVRATGVTAADQVAATGNLVTVTRQLLSYREPDEAAKDTPDGFESVVPGRRPAPTDPVSRREAFVGARLTVRVTVEARAEVQELVLEDPIFAGCEPIEAGIRSPLAPPIRRESGFIFRIPRIAKGAKIVITYPVVCGLAGRFDAMPAEARCYFDPEIKGASASMSLVIHEDRKLMAMEVTRPPTPDVRLAKARKAFSENAWADVIAAVGGLTKEQTLHDGLHDEVLQMLQVAYVRLNRGRDAITVRDELLARNPGAAQVGVEIAVLLGKAYSEAKDAERARELFRQAREWAFQIETTQAQQIVEWSGSDLLDMINAAELGLDSVLRYPAEGSVPASELSLASAWRGIPDPKLLDKPLLPQQRVLWRRALDGYGRIMAWQGGSYIAELASLDRIATYKELGLSERVHVDASAFITRFAKSETLDRVFATDAWALFELQRFDESKRQATVVLDRVWPVVPTAKRPSGPSVERAAMAWLLGKVAHVQGDFEVAVARYAEAKEGIADAALSHAFLTERTLSIPSTVTVEPGRSGSLSVTAKNVEKVTVMVYPVDLTVLFAVRKSFEALNRADLSGITAATTTTASLGLKKYTAGTVSVSLPELADGAYLTVVTDGEKSATVLVLATTLSLRLQRTSDGARADLTDRDGRPVAGARVSVGASGSVRVAGETDSRGLIDLGELPGAATVVAEKAAQVAVVQD